MARITPIPIEKFMHTVTIKVTMTKRWRLGKLLLKCSIWVAIKLMGMGVEFVENESERMNANQ